MSPASASVTCNCALPMSDVAPSARERPALTARTGELLALPATTVASRLTLSLAPPVAWPVLARVTVAPISTSSTYQPVPAMLVSEAMRKRTWKACPARELRSARVWIYPELVPSKAERPPMGFENADEIVPVYPFWVIRAPMSFQVAPLSVEYSTTPPSKPLSVMKSCQNCNSLAPLSVTGLAMARYWSESDAGFEANQALSAAGGPGGQVTPVIWGWTMARPSMACTATTPLAKKG